MQKRTTVYSGLVMLFVISCINIVGQESIEKREITIHFERAPFGKVIEKLVEEYDIAFGFEQSLVMDHQDVFFDYFFEPNVRYEPLSRTGQPVVWPEQTFKAKRHWFSVNFDKAILSEVMDAIVAQMPDYKWEIKNGVVNFVPAKNRDETFQKLLEVRITRFEIEQPRIIWVDSALHLLPELGSFFQENNICNVNSYPHSYIFYERKLSEDLRFSDLTLRDLLNEITRIKRGGWILRWRQYSNGKKCVNLNI